MLKFVLLNLIFFTTINCYGQKLFKVNIELPKNYQIKNILIYYDRGDGEFQIKDKKNDFELDILDTLKSTYAVVTLNFINDLNESIRYDKFLVKEINSKISYNTIHPKTLESDSLIFNPQLYNVLNLKYEGEILYKLYIKTIKDDLDLFTKVNNEKIMLNDSTILAQYFDKINLIHQKTYNFIINNPKLYYSFYIFKNILIYSKISVDKLNYLFYNIFSEELRNNIDGQTIQTLLFAKSLKSGTKAPLFKAVSINGDSVVLNNHENILLVFWASWCKPCIEELPAIIKIREKYGENQLKIISISLDKNTAVIKNLANKFNMNWVHVKGSSDILNKYIVSGIPEIFLIIKGTIIYKRDEEINTKINELSVLNQKLLTIE